MLKPPVSQTVKRARSKKSSGPAVCFSSPSADRSAAGRHGSLGARWPSAYMCAVYRVRLYAARCLACSTAMRA